MNYRAMTCLPTPIDAPRFWWQILFLRKRIKDKKHGQQKRRGVFFVRYRRITRNKQHQEEGEEEEERQRFSKFLT